MLSTLANASPARAPSLRFDLAGPHIDIERQVSALRAWAGPLRAWARAPHRSQSHRGLAHAVLADATGVWAWAPADRYAAATRHADVRDWMRAHPRTDMRLWISGDLMHGLDDPATPAPRDDAQLRSQARQAFVARHGRAAATWPLVTWRNDNAVPGVLALAGLDLEAVCHQGLQYGVHVTSVVPWWHHAFVEARRCVPRLDSATTAQVCVVEGLQAVWIVAETGVVSRIRRITLREASVDALRDAIGLLSAGAASEGVLTVVLGQGLVDGGSTQALDALVLGRLDGHQPPQWLRPCTQKPH